MKLATASSMIKSLPTVLKNLMARDAKRCGKLEKKLELLQGGYRKRATALERKCQTLQQALAGKSIDLAAFQALANAESLAKPQRLAAMQRCISEQAEREAALQERYAAL